MIYFVVTGGVVLIANIIRFEGKIIRILAVTIVQAVEIIGLSYLVILPFTLKFDTMVQGGGTGTASFTVVSASDPLGTSGAPYCFADPVCHHRKK